MIAAWLFRCYYLIGLHLFIWRWEASVDIIPLDPYILNSIHILFPNRARLLRRHVLLMVFLSAYVVLCELYVKPYVLCTHIYDGKPVRQVSDVHT